MSLWGVFESALGGLIAILIAGVAWHLGARIDDWWWERDERKRWRERSAKVWPGVVTSDGKPTVRHPATKR